MRATIRLGIAVLNVELRDDVDDIDAVWKDVDEAVEEVTDELPEGALPPQVDHELNETESVVVAVTGNADVLVLADGEFFPGRLQYYVCHRLSVQIFAGSSWDMSEVMMKASSSTCARP